LDISRKEGVGQDSNIFSRGDPQKFFQMKLSTIFLRIVYPGVLTAFLTEYDFETAKKHVWDLGYRVSRYVFNNFKTKSTEFEKILAEIGEKVWGTKFKIQFDKQKGTYLISPKACPLCEDMPPLELKGLHNCFPLEGFLTGYFELLKEHHLFDYKDMVCKVLQSKGSGADSCLYEVKLTI